MNPITKFADLLYAFLGRRSTIDFVPKEAFTFGMLLSTSFLILAWPCWLAAQTQTVQVVPLLVNFSGQSNGYGRQACLRHSWSYFAIYKAQYTIGILFEKIFVLDSGNNYIIS